MSYFGTDGIRGKFGQMPITPEFALKLGFAAGKVLKRNSPKNKPIVVLGKDTRLSGYILEAALQAGLNAAGVYVHLLGPLPTPAIAHLTRALHAHAGIVISASHNPYFDNGIKFFSSEGKKLPDTLQDEINQELEKDLVIDDTANLGKSVRVTDANGRYIEFCKSTFPYHFNLHNLKIVVDCANGAAYSVGPSVFRELGAKVISLFNEPDGLNINENCGSTHPEQLQKAVVEYQADLGIAFDGDAVIFSEESQEIYDSQGLDAFDKNEKNLANKPLSGGPFKPFLSELHRIQNLFPQSDCPIRIALVTARSAPSHERVIRTLREWKIRIDESLFLGGLQKVEFLKVYQADIFFDDQEENCDSASEEVPTGQVVNLKA